MATNSIKQIFHRDMFLLNHPCSTQTYPFIHIHPSTARPKVSDPPRKRDKKCVVLCHLKPEMLGFKKDEQNARIMSETSRGVMMKHFNLIYYDIL